MLGAIKDLLHSEKAVAGGVLVIAATVLTVLGHMTVDSWTAYTQWIFGIYVGGKTATSAVAMITAPKPEATKEPT